MKKYVILGSILTVTIVVIFFLNNKGQSITRGSIITDSVHSEDIECNRDYKNILLSLELENTSSDEEMSVRVIDPNGNIIDEKKVEKNDSLNYEKATEGIKGMYKIEFNKNNDTSSYSYKINFKGEN